MKVLYRISDGGHIQNKLPNATKLHCLKNCIEEFGHENIYLFADRKNLTDHTKIEIEALNGENAFAHFEYYEAGSSAASFRYSMNYALNNFSDDVKLYFCEDDHLHLPGCKAALTEVLDHVHYATGYLHGDRFISRDRGGSKHAEDFGSSGGFATWLFKTSASFWIIVESTVMTFATTIKTLREDANIWNKYIAGPYPQDYLAFKELTDTGRGLAASIPALSTHCDIAWTAPLIGTGIKSWDTV